MRALLDEQLSREIAVLLRQAGCDVVAVAERNDLIGSSDRAVLDVAIGEDRAVITNNTKDFRPLAAERLSQGLTHAGLVLVPSSRTRTRSAVATLAAAIEQILRNHPHGLKDSERCIAPLSRA